MSIQNNVSLKPYNTFGVDATADSFVDADSVEVFDELMNSFDDTSQAIILGGGSNILFTKERYSLVVRPKFKGIDEPVKHEDDSVTVKVRASETWDDFVDWAVAHGFSGAENLSGIPGTVGAAAVQNIGAYGAEVSNLIVEVSAVDLFEHRAVNLNKQDCAFDYRNSLFKRQSGRFLVIAVTFRLSNSFTPNLSYSGLQTALAGKSLTPKNVREAVLDIRHAKLPDYHKLGNAGSFFKNPLIPLVQAEELRKQYPSIPMFTVDSAGCKTSAAWLIDQCGWKGVRHGNVGCYEHHSLILVNHGGASGKEIMAFANEIIASVEAKFSITLEPEVVIR